MITSICSKHQRDYNSTQLVLKKADILTVKCF